jgi:mRNA-degrading endonuclease RelE of RelBE toxin-antitoxin system
VSYDVVVLPSARSDFLDLAKRDRELVRAALSVTNELRQNPWLGKEMRPRLGLQELRDCRRIAFDRSDWKGKPRYRLIYRNEPSDGVPHVVAILAAAERENLGAYRRAKPRLIDRLRALGEQDAPSPPRP